MRLLGLRLPGLSRLLHRHPGPELDRLHQLRVQINPPTMREMKARSNVLSGAERGLRSTVQVGRGRGVGQPDSLDLILESRVRGPEAPAPQDGEERHDAECRV